MPDRWRGAKKLVPLSTRSTWSIDNVKTVVIGGTFNPVHIGHLYLAEEARRQGGYERVIFVPSHIPAHKNPDYCTAPEDRLEMLRRAVCKSDFIVDDCEIR